MEVLVSERMADVIAEAKIEEKNPPTMSSKVADILNVPVNTARGRVDFEELSLLHIVWD
jgi:hypothetical protein